MEDKDLLELLKKLNSLDINELDEEIAKMQITYEQWSKLMGDKGYWSAVFSDILLEDKEEYEEYLGKIKECQESIKRCEGFQNARGGIDLSLKNIAFS